MLLWYSSFVLYIEFSYAIEEKKRKTLLLPDTWGWHKKISYNHLQCYFKGVSVETVISKEKKKKRVVEDPNRFTPAVKRNGFRSVD